MLNLYQKANDLRLKRNYTLAHSQSDLIMAGKYSKYFIYQNT